VTEVLFFNKYLDNKYWYISTTDILTSKKSRYSSYLPYLDTKYWYNSTSDTLTSN